MEPSDWRPRYDPPQRIEEYLHRAGRTARIGRKGQALLFLQPSELGFLKLLESYGVTGLKEVSVQSLLQLPHDAPGGVPEDLRAAREYHKLLTTELMRRVQSQPALLSAGRGAFLAALRAYRAVPPELREVLPAQELHLGHFAAAFGLRAQFGCSMCRKLKEKLCFLRNTVLLA